MIVYLAGPMRGYKRWNFDAFDLAEKRWREAGYDPISPAQIDRALGIDPDGSIEQVNGAFAKRAMQLDVVLIYSAEALALFPGWEGSSGATVELSLALYLGLPIYGAVSMMRIYPEPHPWKERMHNALQV